MPIDSINSFFDIPAIQAEFAAIKTGLGESQSSLVGLYNVIKGFKDTSISTLAANTEQLSSAINGSVQATTKAKSSYDDLTQKIAAQVKAVNESITSLNENSEAYDQLIKQAVKNKIANDDLAASANALKKAYSGGQISLDQYQQSLADIKEAQVSLKISNADVTRALNNMEKQAQSSSGSLDQLRAKLGELTQAYDKLSESERATESGRGLQKTIQTLDTTRKELEATTGRFGTNVGNYFNSLQPSFNVLKDQLVGINAELAEMDAKRQSGVQNLGAVGFKTAAQRQSEGLSGQTGSGPTNLAGGIGFDPERYKQLSGQAQVLNGILGLQTKDFKTTRQEARAYREAAVQLGLTMGTESEEFLAFDKAVGHVQKSINDIKEVSKFQSSDLKLFKGLIDGATGLAGAFGAAEAGAALFGEEDANLQKQMLKFQQLLVLVNGLQAVANSLRAESGAMQLLLATRTGLLNAAQSIQLLVTTKAVQSISAKAAAEAADATAQEAQTAATVEQTAAEGAKAAATVESTEATVANAAASATAAKGVSSLGTTFIAAGIAGLAIAAGSALAFLSAKLIGFGEASGPSADQQKDIAGAVKELNDALEEEVKIFDDLDEGQRRYYSNLIANAKAAGASQYEILLAQQRSDKAEAERAQAEVTRLGATDAAYSQQAQKVQQLLALRANAAKEIEDLSNIPESKQTWKQKNTLSRDQILLGTYKAQLDEAQDTFNKMTAARQKAKDINDHIAEGETEFNKMSLDDQLEYTEKTETLRVALIKAKNGIILSQEKSTLKERLTAIESNLKAEEAALSAQGQRIKNTPSNYVNGMLTPQALEQMNDLNEKGKEVRLKSLDDETKLKRSYYERDRDARLEIYRQSNADSQAAEADVLSRKIGHGENDVTAGAKQQALVSQLQEQKNLIEQNRKEDLDAQGLTNNQKLAINKKYDSELELLDIKYLKDQRELNKEIKDSILADNDLYYEERKTQLDKESDLEIDALNQRLEAGKISRRRYADEVRKIEEKNAKETIDRKVNSDYVHVASTKDGTKERADAEKQLQADLRAQSKTRKDNFIADQDADLKKVQDTSEKIAAVAENGSNAVAAVWNIGFRTQQVDLENLEKREERSYALQQKQIQDSSASIEQKALRTKILDDQKAAQDIKNARKQKQLDIEKAKFDRDKSIFDIIIGGERAVVEALPNIPLAVSVGILAAAELAAAISVPLPKYKGGAGIQGRPAHKGGLGVVGDAFVPELIAEPGKAPFWSPAVPTVLDMAPGAKIYPAEEINRMISSGMFVNQFGIIQQKETNRDLLEVKQAIIWQTGRIERALAKNKPKVINNIKLDTKYSEHIYKSVFR